VRQQYGGFHLLMNIEFFIYRLGAAGEIPFGEFFINSEQFFR
jgi:hypothetical protein